MQGNFIVRLSEDSLHCFYHDNGHGVCQRIYKNGKWAPPVVLIPDARENYTVNVAYDGSVYIFSQDQAGNINLCTNRSGEWRAQSILKNQKETAFRIIFNAIITETGMTLLYNVPGDDDKTQTLVSQTLNQRGQWGTANRIEPFVSLPNNVFQTQAVTHGHSLIFYQTVKTPQARITETNVGYREISPDKISDFNVFHTTTYPIADYAFLTTNDAVHVAFVVKGMFSYQLIYRKKTGKEFSNPVVVYEGQKIENCLMMFVKGRLHISFAMGGQMFVCSADSGQPAFSQPVRYRNKICQNPVKACYLSAPTMSAEKFFCREIYVDSFCPWDIQMLPDLFEDFFPVPAPPEAPQAQRGMDEVLYELESLKKQLELAQLQLMEKEKIIRSLRFDK